MVFFFLPVLGWEECGCDILDPGHGGDCEQGTGWPVGRFGALLQLNREKYLGEREKKSFLRLRQKEIDSKDRVHFPLG